MAARTKIYKGLRVYIVKQNDALLRTVGPFGEIEDRGHPLRANVLQGSTHTLFVYLPPIHVPLKRTQVDEGRKEYISGWPLILGIDIAAIRKDHARDGLSS